MVRIDTAVRNWKLGKSELDAAREGAAYAAADAVIEIGDVLVTVPSLKGGEEVPEERDILPGAEEVEAAVAHDLLGIHLGFVATGERRNAGLLLDPLGPSQHETKGLAGVR